VALALAAARMHLLALINRIRGGTKKHSKRRQHSSGTAMVHQRSATTSRRSPRTLGCTDIQSFDPRSPAGDAQHRREILPSVPRG